MLRTLWTDTKEEEKLHEITEHNKLAVEGISPTGDQIAAGFISAEIEK